MKINRSLARICALAGAVVFVGSSALALPPGPGSAELKIVVDGAVTTKQFPLDADGQTSISSTVLANDGTWKVVLNSVAVDHAVAGGLSMNGSIGFENLNDNLRNVQVSLNSDVDYKLVDTAVGGTLTVYLNTNFNGGVLSTSGIASIIEDNIDGKKAGEMLHYPFNMGVVNGSANLQTPANFGMPLGSDSGPNLGSDFGVEANFSLTGGDKVTFATNFMIAGTPVYEIDGNSPALPPGSNSQGGVTDGDGDDGIAATPTPNATPVSTAISVQTTIPNSTEGESASTPEATPTPGEVVGTPAAGTPVPVVGTPVVAVPVEPIVTPNPQVPTVQSIAPTFSMKFRKAKRLGRGKLTIAGVGGNTSAAVDLRARVGSKTCDLRSLALAPNSEAKFQVISKAKRAVIQLFTDPSAAKPQAMVAVKNKIGIVAKKAAKRNNCSIRLK